MCDITIKKKSPIVNKIRDDIKKSILCNFMDKQSFTTGLLNFPFFFFTGEKIMKKNYQQDNDEKRIR